MDGITSSIVSTMGLAVVALLTFALNERAKRAADWRSKKLEYYADFFDSLAQNLEGFSSEDTHKAFARETNNLNLIASAEVLRALHVYREQIGLKNLERDYSKDTPLLTNLIKAMRRDLRMPGEHDLTEDLVKLWAPGPRKRTLGE